MNLHPTARGARALAMTAAALVAATVLASCSGAIIATPTTPPPTASMTPTTPSPSPSAVGTSPGTWTPLLITDADNGKTFTMVPGQVATFQGLPMNNAEDLNVAVSDDSVAVFARGEAGPGHRVSTLPTLTAKKPGTTEVAFTYDEQGASPGANVAFSVTIEVTAQ